MCTCAQKEDKSPQVWCGSDTSSSTVDEDATSTSNRGGRLDSGIVGVAVIIGSFSYNLTFLVKSTPSAVVTDDNERGCSFQTPDVLDESNSLNFFAS